MKIYEYIEMDMDGNVIDEISHDHQGKVAECKGGSSSKTTTEPPTWVKAYMPHVANMGWGLAQNPLQFFKGSTIADFTPEQLQAQDMVRNRALAGSPLLGKSKHFIKSVMTGKGEEFDRMLNAGLTKVIPGAAGGGIQGGMYGSSAYNQAMGQAVGDVVGNMGMQAAQLAPQLAREDYYDMSQLAGLGQEKQSMRQAKINEQMARWQFGQTEPWERLGMFTNLLQGDYGGNVSTTSSGGK